MKWRGRRQSDNVIDRRTSVTGGRTVVGGGLGMIVIVILVILLGGDPRALLQQVQQNPNVAVPGGQAAELSELDR